MPDFPRSALMSGKKLMNGRFIYNGRYFVEHGADGWHWFDGQERTVHGLPRETMREALRDLGAYLDNQRLVH